MNGVGILDIQCFYDNHNDFIVKELAVLPLVNDENINDTPEAVFFKAPYAFSTLKECVQRANNWNTKYHHHLHWTEGTVPYNDLLETLKGMVKPFWLLLVKGTNKTLFIERLMNRLGLSIKVVNAEVFMEESLKKIVALNYYNCTHQGACALRNCMKIRQQFFNEKSV